MSFVSYWSFATTTISGFKLYLIEIAVQQTNFKLFCLKIVSKFFAIGLLGDEDQNGAGGSELDQMFEEPIPLATADGHHLDDLPYVLTGLADLTLYGNKNQFSGICLSSLIDEIKTNYFGLQLTER